jgi:nitrogen fixation protein FixH
MIRMNSTDAKPSRNLWPHAIIAWFVIFAAAMAAWITVAVRQKLDLVRSDYYEEEVRFQRHLEQLNRTAAIGSEVTFNYDASKREVALRVPAAHLPSRPVGHVRFYRPSDAALDFQIPLAIDADGFQRVGTSGLRGGFWKVRLQWNAAGQDYFFEQVLVLDEAERQPIPVATRPQ